MDNCTTTPPFIEGNNDDHLFKLKSMFNLADHLLKRLSCGLEGSVDGFMPPTFVRFSNFSKLEKEMLLSSENKTEADRKTEEIFNELMRGTETCFKIFFHDAVFQKLKDRSIKFESDKEYYDFFAREIVTEESDKFDSVILRTSGEVLLKVSRFKTAGYNGDDFEIRHGI